MSPADLALLAALRRTCRASLEVLAALTELAAPHADAEVLAGAEAARERLAEAMGEGTSTPVE
jgi:hypothetical protein